MRLSPAHLRDLLQQAWQRLPFRFHWLLVLLTGALIPWATSSTEKPGEFYPFSNFPMYSSFSPDTYFVWVSDLEDKALPIATLFGMAPSDVKKSYDRKLSAQKEFAPRGLRKVELPLEFKRVAGNETLEWLMGIALERGTLGDNTGLRLHHVDILYREGVITQVTTEVGEVQRP